MTLSLQATLLIETIELSESMTVAQLLWRCNVCNLAVAISIDSFDSFAWLFNLGKHSIGTLDAWRLLILRSLEGLVLKGRVRLAKLSLHKLRVVYARFLRR